MSPQKNQSWEDKLQKQMEKLEEKVENIGKKLDRESEKFARGVEKKVTDVSKNFGKHKPKHSLIWGIIFICIGLLWLGENLNWFYHVPLIPVIMIIIGILLIIKDSEKNKTTSSNVQEKEKRE